MFDQTMIAATVQHPAASPSASPAQVAVLAGTTIRTLDGEKRAEDLLPGDRIITRDCGTAVLVDVCLTRADVATLRIKAGAIGPAQPERDMALPVTAVLHLRHGRVSTPVAAADLIGTGSASLADRTLSTMVSLIFLRPHIIYADGVELWATPA